MSRLFTTVFFIFILVSVKTDLNNAIHLKVDPAVFDVVENTNVEITCAPDNGTTNVQLIEIFRAGGKLVASVNLNNTHYSSETAAKYQVTGQINQNALKSFLKLVLLHPEPEDNGVYRCVLHHLDGATLNTEQANQDLTVLSLDMVLQSLQNQVAALQEPVDIKDSDIESRLTYMEEKLKNYDISLNDLFDKGDFTSAFSAAISKPPQFTKGQPVVFDTVLMTAGENYDKNTGIFTAPRDGVYYFYLTLGTMTDTIGDYVNIMINKQKSIAYMGTGSLKNVDENSISTVVELKTGDEVQVVMAFQGKGQYKNETVSLFGGFCVNTF